MIAKKPLSSDERVLRYAEHAAEFDIAENLDVYGRHLNFFQYYSLDVILPVLAFTILVLTLLVFAVVKLCACVRNVVRKRRYQKVE